jgi:DNA polymerase-3 subunit gamma/tau
VFFETRARKKKGLTEPIDILPFPTQSLRKSKTQSTVSAPSENPATQVAESPKVKILESPQGQVHTKHLSIKEAIERSKQAAQEVRIEDQPREQYHLDHVKMYWKQYAYKLKENGMETFYNALIKRDPILQGPEHIELVVDNIVQRDYIQTHLMEFIDFMRKQLNNYFISIQIVVSEQAEEEVKYLNGKDKFNAMARKNPNLHTLKTRFNLDIDY